MIPRLLLLLSVESFLLDGRGTLNESEAETEIERQTSDGMPETGDPNMTSALMETIDLTVEDASSLRKKRVKSGLTEESERRIGVTRTVKECLVLMKKNSLNGSQEDQQAKMNSSSWLDLMTSQRRTAPPPRLSTRGNAADQKRKKKVVGVEEAPEVTLQLLLKNQLANLLSCSKRNQSELRKILGSKLSQLLLSLWSRNYLASILMISLVISLGTLGILKSWLLSTIAMLVVEVDHPD